MAQESSPSDVGKPAEAGSGRELTHEETLAWIVQHRAWRHVRKKEAIWARPVTDDEVGRQLETIDGAHSTILVGQWMCVGVTGERWLQMFEKITAKYREEGSEPKRIAPDEREHTYHRFVPRPEIMNWAACIDGADVAGFSIRQSHAPDKPYHSQRGGYVVMPDAPDPYQGPSEVWLVQRKVFEQTYEVIGGQ